MGDTDDNQARFTHTFSSPLTAMRGAIDLLRNPRRTTDDPVSRELIETLERSCARWRRNIPPLLPFRGPQGDLVGMGAPVDPFRGGGDPPATPPDRHLPPAPAPGVPWTEAASAPDRSAGRGSV